MPADVESVAVVLDRPGEAADLAGIPFQDRDRYIALQELVGGRESRRPRAHDHDVLSSASGDQSAHKYRGV